MKLGIACQTLRDHCAQVFGGVRMPSAESKNRCQIVLQGGLLIIAAITGGDLRKIPPMLYEEELAADDMIAGGRRQVAAVNTKFPFEFFLHCALNSINGADRPQKVEFSAVRRAVRKFRHAGHWKP